MATGQYPRAFNQGSYLLQNDRSPCCRPHFGKPEAEDDMEMARGWLMDHTGSSFWMVFVVFDWFPRGPSTNIIRTLGFCFGVAGVRGFHTEVRRRRCWVSHVDSLSSILALGGPGYLELHTCMYNPRIRPLRRDS